MRLVEHSGSIVHLDTTFYLPKYLQRRAGYDHVRVPELRPGRRIDTIDSGVKTIQEVFCVGEQVFIEYQFRFKELDEEEERIKIKVAHGCHINFRGDGLQAPINTKLWEPKRIFSAYAYQIRFKERQCVFRDSTGLGYLSFVRDGDELHDPKKIKNKKRNKGAYYRDRTRTWGKALPEGAEEGRGDRQGPGGTPDH